MIENTFIFIPGVGPGTEKKLWDQGVKNWNDFLNASEVKGLGKAKKLMADKRIKEAKRSLREGDAEFFHKVLPLSHHWRLYDEFYDEAVYLDIETSGGYGSITVIGLYDGYEVKHMVKGANLYRKILAEELSRHKLIVTFNGASFDVPVINKYFKDVVPEVPHVDLRHVCSKIGLTGGLKVIEKELGIERGDAVEGLFGGDAVALWDRFRVTKDEKYLKMLLEYNAEDILNLKPLADYAVGELKKKILN